jgi:K+-sensing histidine kinase KdpD
LLRLALRTAVDVVHADCGRLSVRHRAEEPLSESVRVGSLSGLEERLLDAERTALAAGALGEANSDGLGVVAIALGPLDRGGLAQGLITVGRRGEPFSEEDRELLRSLATQATLALENVELHFQTQRHVVTTS